MRRSTATTDYLKECMGTALSGHHKVILDVYLNILDSGKQEEDITTYYRQNGTAYALFGIVNAWILRGYKETPEQMVEILYDLRRKGGDSNA